MSFWEEIGICAFTEDEPIQIDSWFETARKTGFSDGAAMSLKYEVTVINLITSLPGKFLSLYFPRCYPAYL